MTEETTKEVLERLGFDKDKAESFGKGGITTGTIIKGNHIVIDGDKNVVYSGDEGARVYYFKGGSYCSTTSKDLKFPLTAPQLIEEYYNLKLALYIEKNEPSNFLKSDLKKEFHAKEILEAEQRLMSNRKMLNTLFPTTPESSTTNGRYLGWLNEKQFDTTEKNGQPQQTEPEPLDLSEKVKTAVEKSQKAKPQGNTLKQFFIEEIDPKIINTLQIKYKDLYGKKMAYLIYLLHKEFKLINYSLRGTKDNRKRFVNEFTGKNKNNIEGINKNFNPNDITLEIDKYHKDNDYITIQNEIQTILDPIK